MSSAIILDGKAIADNILLEIRKKIIASGREPGLAAILVGDNPASQIYVRLKEKAAEKIGIIFHKYLLTVDNCNTEEKKQELIELIEFLNRDPMVDGILLQLPLPEGMDQDKIVKLISTDKDADGFISQKIMPPTIAAIIELLKATGENLVDKKTLIIGKSDIFTKGIEKYLKKILAIKTVTNKNNIPADSDTYDIIIIALGKPYALIKNDIKDGAIIIDVGINKTKTKTVGDVDPSVEETAGYLSPVPGGVGPLTVACLMRNVFELSQDQK
jgi:methylenetetrahydrofolate dehydrogenase (NADP+)/methenyltetrahydrofolate cyclohydrolase